MQATRLFSGDDGESHLEPIEISLEDVQGIEKMSEQIGAECVVFNETTAKHQYDWHNAPKKQWVITISGEIEVEVGDGTTARFGPGDVLLAEDSTGRGHRTRLLGDSCWRCVYVVVRN